MSDEYVPVAINSRIETEEVLGPLPDNWEKAPFQDTKRFFFVDHNTQTTTWIDPRTFYLRKHDIKEIVAGELPYGWEEAFDQVCGIYYIDHVKQKHYLDGPWEESVRNLYNVDPLEEENKKLEAQLDLERQKKEELDAAEAKLKELESEKERIENQINELRAKEEQEHENEEMLEALRQEEAQLNAQLENVNTQLESDRAAYEQANNEYIVLHNEIEEFQKRLAELRAVNERLQNENKELMEHTQEANNNLAEMRTMIEMEAAQRAALEAYIKQLKNEVLQMYNPEQAEAIREQDNAQEVDPEAPLPEPGTLDENEEFAHLQNRLEEERKERERLKQLTESLEAERNKIQSEPEAAGAELPDWVVQINVNAQKPTTLKRRVGDSEAQPASTESPEQPAEPASEQPAEPAAEQPAESSEQPKEDNEDAPQ